MVAFTGLPLEVCACERGPRVTRSRNSWGDRAMMKGKGSLKATFQESNYGNRLKSVGSTLAWKGSGVSSIVKFYSPLFSPFIWLKKIFYSMIWGTYLPNWQGIFVVRAFKIFILLEQYFLYIILWKTWNYNLLWLGMYSLFHHMILKQAKIKSVDRIRMK